MSFFIFLIRSSVAATALMSWSACAVGILVFLIAGMAQAVTLTRFSFGPEGFPTYSPDLTASGLSVSNMTLTQNGVLQANSFSPTSDPSFGKPLESAGKAGGWGAATTNNYFETVITALPGSTFELTALTYEILILSSAGQTNGIRFNPNSEGFNRPGLGAGGDVRDFTLLIADLSAPPPDGDPAIEGRTDLTTLAVQIFFAPQSTGAFFAIDNVNFEGNVFQTDSIPEPSTMLLLGSGLVGLAAWRRKKAA